MFLQEVNSTGGGLCFILAAIFCTVIAASTTRLFVYAPELAIVLLLLPLPVPRALVDNEMDFL